MGNLDAKKIGSFIKWKRESLGLTQKGLGLTLNRSDKSISKWERGESIPPIDIILDLARERKCEETEILRGTVHAFDLDGQYAGLFLFNKNAENKIVYRDIIFDFGDLNDVIKMNNILMFMKLDDARRYESGYFGLLTACRPQTITVCSKKEKEEYISLKELFLKEIGTYNPDSSMIGNFIQAALCNLWDGVYYSLYGYRAEDLIKMEADDLDYFDSDDIFEFLSYKETIEVLTAFKTAYFDSIKKRVIQSKERKMAQ